MIYPFATPVPTNQKQFDLGNFTSPIFREAKDPQDLKMTFNRYPIIPFFGANEDTSDSVLNMLHSLAEVTPLVAGIVESVGNFALGGGMGIERRMGLGVINRATEPATPQQVEAFEREFLDTFPACDLHATAERLIKSLTIDGNAGLRVKAMPRTGVAHIEYVKTTRWRYMRASWGKKEKAVMISNSFLYSHLTEVEPEILPVYPAFSEDADGTLQTFIHAKVEAPNRTWYGLSSGAASLMHQYLLNQLFVYLSAETDNRFTGKVFFDVEAEPTDMEGNFSDNMNNFVNAQRNAFTNAGTRRSSIMNRFRSQGMEKAYIHEFKANTEHQFYESMTQILNQSVLSAYGWDKRLLGDNSDAGLFGERLQAVYAGASQKVKPLQSRVAASLNKAVKFVEDATNKSILSDFNLRLDNLYQQMVKEEAEAEKTANAATSSNTDQNQ